MKFLITAGPTREAIDPVRYISNRSSGKMGYAIAEAAIAAGHEVTLISGPVCLTTPRGAKVINVITAAEMFAAVQKSLLKSELLIMCAAVADYKPMNFSQQKIKKQKAPLSIALEPTPDILSSLKLPDRKIIVVGFAAETESLRTNAKKKLRAKNCDVIVANDVSRAEVGMESDDNKVILFFQNGETRSLPRAKKKALAPKLVTIFASLAEKS